MTAQDALRKIRLLRRLNPESGAFETEADNAARLSRLLMERYAVGKTEETQPSAPRFRLTWVYWEALLDEFGMPLRRFGRRGNAALGRDRIIHIKLDTGQWWAERNAAGGLETEARDWGVESLRAYLVKNVPRAYTSFRH